MFSIDNWQEIFHTIRKNKLRTFLTAFSVSWGIFMLIFLLGAGDGLQRGVEYQFSDDATNRISLRGGTTSKPYKGTNPGKRISFTNEDFSYINELIEGIDKISGRFYCWGEMTVRHGKKYSSFDVLGVHPEHRFIEKQNMVQGRYINEIDINQRRKVAAIGTKVVEGLFEDDVDPVGKWIDVNGIPYKVIGVYEDPGGEGELRRIMIPITCAQLTYNGSNQLHNIMFTVGAATVEESKKIENETIALLSKRHQFDPEDKKAISLWNSVETFKKFNDMFVIIKMILAIVGIGTILAGVVGVSNIMLITVKERTREIGLRKALGATPRSIISLILLESVFVTVAAGYFGLIAGIGLVELIGYAMAQMPEQPEFFRSPQVSINLALGATLFLVFCGVLAGFFPARKAAKIEPIVALRDE